MADQVWLFFEQTAYVLLKEVVPSSVEGLVRLKPLTGTSTSHGKAFTAWIGKVRLLFSLLVVLSYMCHITESQSNVVEKELLQKFFESVTDQRLAMWSWDKDNHVNNSSPEPCNISMKGVICKADKQVAAINLHDLHLAGDASTSITYLCQLPRLQSLDLSGNNFHGSPPEGLQNAIHLISLRLQRNDLNGTIPKLPPTLGYLSLHSNHLEGGLAGLQTLDQLYELDVHSNKLNGSLPENKLWSLWLHSGAYMVDVSDNEFDGAIPSELGKLGGWYEGYLNLSLNRLTGGIPWPADRTWRVETVDLSSNQLNGTIPNEFLQSNFLKFANCSNNNLSGSINWTNVGEGQFRDLTVLDFSHNQLDSMVGEVGDKLGRTLQILRLQNNLLGGDMTNFFSAHFSKLTELRLSYNRLATISGPKPDAGLQIQTNFPALEILDLDHNGLKGEVPAGLHHMPSLRELRLRDNHFTATGVVSGSEWKYLEILDLTNNKLIWSEIAGDLGAIFKVCLNLRELRLGNNDFSGSGPKNLAGSLEKLQVLDLSYCRLEGSVSSLFKYLRLPALVYLDLSNNFLSGNLEEETFKRMPKLTHFDLSNNSLSGTIPPLPNAALEYPVFFLGNRELCGLPLNPCLPKPDDKLQPWHIALIVLGGIIVGVGSGLCSGFMWRKRADSIRRNKDEALIKDLLLGNVPGLMHFKDLQSATENFSAALQIGKGGFGTVYRGTLNHKLVAVKKSNRAGDLKSEIEFLNEVKILSQVHHRNLVSLLGCCFANNSSLLVFEYVPNGTLEQHLQRKRVGAPLSWKQRLHIALQAAEALDYLHSKANPPIYHLDIKSANILLDDKLDAKVADFGISKLVPGQDATTSLAAGGFTAGTPGYMDPEIFMTSSFSSKSDVYALGVVLLELVSAQPAVDRSAERELWVHLVNKALNALSSGKLDEIVDPTIKETFMSVTGRESISDVVRLAAKCLEANAHRRPTMEVVLSDLRIIWRRDYELVPQDLDNDDYANSILDMDSGLMFPSVKDSK
ncbi:hypothetical protein Mapa_001749 [Marchantia paleacea]|nr:hypothetical protein Mapa_001749 [Marchantia paleacea]